MYTNKIIIWGAEMKKFAVVLLIVLLVGCSQVAVSKQGGRSANFIGDSITEQGFFEHTEYPKVVKSTLGLSSIENYGVGGSSLCLRNEEFNSNYPPLISRWEEIKGADIHFILIGTNDYSFQVPIGEDNSTNLKEFNGCLNIVLGGLKEKYPDDLIVVSTILKRRESDLPIPLTKYNDAIKSKAEEYDLALLDGYNIDGLDIGNDYDGKITDDRLHPNKKGAKLLGEGIADFLESKFD